MFKIKSNIFNYMLNQFSGSVGYYQHVVILAVHQTMADELVFLRYTC